MPTGRDSKEARGNAREPDGTTCRRVRTSRHPPNDDRHVRKGMPTARDDEQAADDQHASQQIRRRDALTETRHAANSATSSYRARAFMSRASDLAR